MIDLPPDQFLVAPFKTSAFETMTVGNMKDRDKARQYIPEGKVILMEVLCENGIFFVLVEGEDYLKWD